MWRWFKIIVLGVVCVAAVVVVMRQGFVPARYTPLPVLDLDAPLPFVTDWQIRELRNSRRLCRAMIASSPKLRARPVADRPLKNGCGWQNAVRPISFGGTRFTAARMSCPVAAAMALWIAYDVQPLAQQIFGRRVISIQNMGVYACRNVIGSRYWGNRRSEHAQANAVDIGGFKLDGGITISVLKDWQSSGRKAEFLRAVHLAACRYFRVVLGPDYNAAHKNHFHFDRGELGVCR